MRKLTTLLGISTLVIAAACGGQDEPGMDEMMDDAEPSSDQMMDDAEPSGMMEDADTMMADSMMADTMMDEGMPEEMMDEDGGMTDDEMGGGI